MTTRYVDALASAGGPRRLGRVVQVSGLGIESAGPDARNGDMCEIAIDGRPSGLRSEVVGVRGGRLVLMPYGSLEGVGIGAEVVAQGEVLDQPVGDAALGRVLDAFGQPLDGRPAPVLARRRSLRAAPINPMNRPPIREVLATGVRVIDALLTLGRGQRLGIFAGSGVGKSTLLGMIARRVQADVNVIALIGERGREVREFIDKHLGAEGLARSVVIVATSDQPALVRARAAYAATALAEHFRDQGRHVLLTMDSITRFAMARREIGLAAGEPPTSRGYTPSVFAELPQLCERCGTSGSGGSITALYTVLVEGDDFNEPISDILRATLDGHVVLSRRLAHEGHYPAIDVLQSASRLSVDLSSAEERALGATALQMLALHERSRAMVDIGAYKAGSNPQLDRVLDALPALNRFLQQGAGEACDRASSLAMLKAAVKPKVAT